MRLIFKLALAFTLLITPSDSFAQVLDEKEEILRAHEECWQKHSSWVWDYFKRSACIDLKRHQIAKKITDNQNLNKELEKRRLSDACLREFVTNTETILVDLRQSIATTSTYNFVKDELKSSKRIPNIIETRNVDDRSLSVLSIPFTSNCELNMMFLLEISEDYNNLIHRFSVWTENAPLWYSPLSHSFREQLSKNFRAERLAELENAKQIMRNKEKQEEARKVKMINSSVSCSYGDSCLLTFGLKNDAKFAIKSVSISFDVYPRDQASSCPTSPAARKNISLEYFPSKSLAVGQTEWRSEYFIVPSAIWQKGIIYCSQIVNVEFL